MKEEELVKKLAATKLPAVELKGHRRRLKMALEAASYPEKHRVSITRLQVIIKGANYNMFKGLKSSQTRWKLLACGFAVAALVIGVMWAMPSSPGTPRVVMAAETMTISPTFSQSAALRDYDIIIFMADGRNIATFSFKTDGKNIVTVNLEAVEPKLSEIKQMGDLLSQSDKQKALDIANADAGVQELLAQGAGINKIVMEFTPYQGTLDSNTIDGICTIAENAAMVLIENGDAAWVAHVDFSTEKVTRLFPCIQSPAITTSTPTTTTTTISK